MTLPDMSALLLTMHLAFTATVLLLCIGTPIAWWLARTQARLKPVIEALIALPLVLPPTVLGFYLLVILNPTAPLGKFWVNLTGEALTFSFSGLVIASILYSLPFMIQPLQSAFETVTKGPMEAAASLGASPLDAFLTIAVPLSLRGFVTATILTFTHTMGEFGVVLMVGGNIPDRTRVVSIAIYEHVETLRYDQANALALTLLVISFSVLFFVYYFNRRFPVHVG